MRERIVFTPEKSEQTEPVNSSLNRKVLPKVQGFPFAFDNEKRRVTRSLAEIVKFFGILYTISECREGLFLV